MEKITLKLYDFLNLEADLNGVRNPSTGEVLRRGLLSYPLPMGTKYWLTKLSKSLAEEKSIIDGLKNELVKKYGSETEDGSISVQMYVTEMDDKGNPVMTKVTVQEGKETFIPKTVINPEYLAFERDYSEILQQEKEFEYRPFTLKDLCTQDYPNGIETDEVYDTFFKLVSDIND
jgi:hypothetical protein